MSLQSKIEHANRLYDSGDFESARKICHQVLKKNKKHVHAYAVLGMIEMNLGHYKKAKEYFLKSIMKIDNNPTLYNNLGNAYFLLDELSDAKECYEKSLELEPSSSITLANLAVIFEKEGDMERAFECAKKAVSYEPANVESLQVLGVLQCNKGKLKESLKLFEDAYAINPNNYLVAKCLCEMYMRLGRHDEAMQILNKIRTTTISDLVELMLDKVTMLFIQGKFEEAESYNNQVPIFHPELKEKKFYMNYLSYFICFKESISFYYNNKNLYEAQDLKPIYFISESHCLPPNQTQVSYLGKNYKAQSKLVRGLKIWHIVNDEPTEYQASFFYTLENLPNKCKVVIGVGEIDCRIDEGIFKNYLSKNIDYRDNIERLLDKYIRILDEFRQSRDVEIILYGVPAPKKIVLEDYKQSEIDEFIKMISYFNNQLSAKCVKYGFPFLDVYALTCDVDSATSNEEYHIDSYHVKPNVLKILFNRLK